MFMRNFSLRLLKMIRLRLEVPALAQGFAGLRKVKLPLVFFLALRSNVVPGTGLLLCTGPDGILVTDITSICLSWVDYYSNLFSAHAIDMSPQDTSICSIKSLWGSF